MKENLKQAIPLKTIEDARELGEYLTTDDRKIKNGVLLRTAKLHGICEEDIHTLADIYGLQHIIDFRMAVELSGAEDPVIDGVQYHHLDVIDSLTMTTGDKPDMDFNELAVEQMAKMALQSGMINENMYIGFLTSDYGRKAFTQFFRILLAAEPGCAVLWHCTSGKDRTGLAAMLLLSALEVDTSKAIKEENKMKTKLENGTLTMYLDGRIDSGNAPEVEKNILAAMEEAGSASIVLPASMLKYISSAGLRVVMKLRKQKGEAFPVINVIPEVYEIFETTGLTQLLDVQKKLREISIEGCDKLGEGGNGAVYRLDEDKIVKVYKPWMEMAAIEQERSFAKTAFVNGIPSVIAYDTVKVGECLGVVFELLRSDTLGHAMRDNPEKLEEYEDQYVALAKTLHNTHVPAGNFTRIQDVMYSKADNLEQWCSSEEIALLHSIIDSVPDTDTVTHNDLHPGNIMLQDNELVLIDMPEVTMGPPVCDLVAIYRDMISAPQNTASVIERNLRPFPVDVS